MYLLLQIFDEKWKNFSGFHCNFERRFWIHSMHRPWSSHVLSLQWNVGLWAWNQSSTGGGVYNNSGNIFFFQLAVIFDTNDKCLQCQLYLMLVGLQIWNGSRWTKLVPVLGQKDFTVYFICTCHFLGFSLCARLWKCISFEIDSLLCQLHISAYQFGGPIFSFQLLLTYTFSCNSYIVLSRCVWINMMRWSLYLFFVSCWGYVWLPVYILWI